MSKIFKNIVATLVCMTLTMTTVLSIVGCGTVDDPEDVIETTKTQLYIGSWNGGLKTKWLSLIADKFEERYKDYCFEPGTDKKGVQVHITPGNYAEDTSLGRVKDSTDDIIVTEQMNYYALIGNGAAMDISDIMTSPLSEYGESKSIKQKMWADDVDFYGQGKGVFYGVPWYTSIFGINYDVDLFDDNFYYFSKMGTEQDPFVSNLTEVRSTGPDGEYCEICANNDYKYSEHVSCDDGLPATFKEFFILCDKMSEDNVTPIIWAGQQKGYVDRWLSSMADSLDGYENAIVNYTLNGESDSIVKFDSNGNPVTTGDLSKDGKFVYEDSTRIDNSNGYLLRRQSGRYYALEFLSKLLNTKESGKEKYVDGGTITSATHTGAQSQFLLSRFTEGQKPVAMLAEGSWWYNEASATFNDMKSIAGAGKTERRIGIMPFPKPYEGYFEGKTPSFTNTWITSIILKNNMPSERVSVAKAFFRFMHTDENLALFVNETHCMRPFNFELSGSAKANASFHLLQQYEYFTSGKYKVVNSWSSNDLVINNLTAFGGNLTSSVASNAIDGLSGNKNTPLEYFKGFYSMFTESNWVTAYNKYIK